MNIEIIGATVESVSNANEINACKKFRPTKSQVIRFFNKAYPVEAAIRNDRYTTCYAEGSLTFSDNYSGRWILFSSGVARFTFLGEDVVYLFYKNNGWHDPFACTYGYSSEGEC